MARWVHVSFHLSVTPFCVWFFNRIITIFNIMMLMIYNIWRSQVKFQGPSEENIDHFGRISPRPDDNSTAFHNISRELSGNVFLVLVWCSIVFEVVALKPTRACLGRFHPNSTWSGWINLNLCLIYFCLSEYYFIHIEVYTTLIGKLMTQCR